MRVPLPSDLTPYGLEGTRRLDAAARRLRRSIGEHVALLRPLASADALYLWDDLLADGVHSVFTLKEGEADMLALLFRGSAFRSEEAQHWMRERGFAALAFVEGTDSNPAHDPKWRTLLS